MEFWAVDDDDSITSSASSIWDETDIVDVVNSRRTPRRLVRNHDLRKINKYLQFWSFQKNFQNRIFPSNFRPTIFFPNDWRKKREKSRESQYTYCLTGGASDPVMVKYGFG